MEQRQTPMEILLNEIMRQFNGDNLEKTLRELGILIDMYDIKFSSDNPTRVVTVKFNPRDVEILDYVAYILRVKRSTLIRLGALSLALTILLNLKYKMGVVRDVHSNI